MTTSTFQELNPVDKYSPDVFCRFTVTEKDAGYAILAPVRGYIFRKHSLVYGQNSNGETIDKKIGARDALIENLSKNPIVYGNNQIDGPDDSTVLLALIWAWQFPGEEIPSQMMDIFAVRNIGGKNWSINTDVFPYLLKDGVYISDPEKQLEVGVTCIDGMGIAGREVEYRRRTCDLNRYLTHPPKLTGILKAGKTEIIESRHGEIISATEIPTLEGKLKQR